MATTSTSAEESVPEMDESVVMAQSEADDEPEHLGESDLSGSEVELSVGEELDDGVQTESEQSELHEECEHSEDESGHMTEENGEEDPSRWHSLSLCQRVNIFLVKICLYSLQARTLLVPYTLLPSTLKNVLLYTVLQELE